MCKPTDKRLSLNDSTFAELKDSFDKILNRTVGNMLMKGTTDATLTLKLGISINKKSVNTNTGYADVDMPSFKYEVGSVMQVKDKVSGTMEEYMAMVWDEETQSFVMRKVDDGQTCMFDDEGNIVEVVEEEPALLPGDTEVDAEDYMEEEEVETVEIVEEVEGEDGEDEDYAYEEPEDEE